MSSFKADKTLDVTGLSCPRPKAITMSVLDTMEPGQSLRVITNDRSTRQSIPELCVSCGYRLLESAEEKGMLYFTIQK